MVGHLIRYHAAFRELQQQISAGAIGKLRHIQANRLAMGRIRNTESVLFDLCPHDLSLIFSAGWQHAKSNSLRWQQPFDSRHC